MIFTVHQKEHKKSFKKYFDEKWLRIEYLKVQNMDFQKQGEVLRTF